MGLNFDQAIPQLDVVAHRLGGSVVDHQAQVDSFINSATALTQPEIIEKLGNVKERPFMAAIIHDTLIGNHAPPSPPSDRMARFTSGHWTTSSMPSMARVGTSYGNLKRELVCSPPPPSDLMARFSSGHMT